MASRTVHLFSLASFQIAISRMVNTMQEVLICGKNSLTLVVTVENEPALNLYQSLGFMKGR
jgi:ribosomal protein S18 acetylase RimI-like enzyme